MLGTQFADHIPISQIFDASYNTAWLLAVIAFILIVVRLAKKWIGKLNTVEN